MPKDVTIDPEAKIIAEIDLTTIKSEWAEYDFQILEQNFCNVNNNLFIRFVNPSENDEAIRIDNLCFELDTCTVGTNDLTGTDFIILPNPTSGQLTIDFKTQINQSLTLRVYDVLGRELNLEYIKEGTSYYNLSINEIAGIYIIQLSDINGESTQRKVIKIE
ncbi:MAG: T9SS type A sorting domain-containing protein [Saprospiraceae bacterium]|nr:T9SS type A sorting domain-containing protein [Saprospiraceae bacterium]